MRDLLIMKQGPKTVFHVIFCPPTETDTRRPDSRSRFTVTNLFSTLIPIVFDRRFKTMSNHLLVNMIKIRINIIERSMQISPSHHLPDVDINLCLGNRHESSHRNQKHDQQKFRSRIQDLKLFHACAGSDAGCREENYVCTFSRKR